MKNDFTMSVTIALPFTNEQAAAVVIAADAFGVPAWEMGAHVLKTAQAIARSADSNAAKRFDGNDSDE